MADNFDRGPSYRTAIFYHNETQKGLAEKSKQALAESGMFKDPIVTEIRPAAPFTKQRNTTNISIKRIQKNMLLNKKNLGVKTL